jgi:hypothetical protein
VFFLYLLFNLNEVDCQTVGWSEVPGAEINSRV